MNVFAKKKNNLQGFQVHNSTITTYFRDRMEKDKTREKNMKKKKTRLKRLRRSGKEKCEEEGERGKDQGAKKGKEGKNFFKEKHNIV